MASSSVATLTLGSRRLEQGEWTVGEEEAEAEAGEEEAVVEGEVGGVAGVPT